MINEINTLANEMIKSEIKTQQIPVLINHIPLFYLLPADGSAMEFRYLRDEWKISKSSLSDILHKYEALGYVEKAAICEDKRCVMIALTKEALKVKEQFSAIEAKILSRMLSGFSDDERGKLSLDIINILNNMKESQ